MRARQLDELVATYAPIGARQKRRKTLRRAIAAGGSAVVVGTIATLWTMDGSILTRLGNALPVVATTSGQHDAAELLRERETFAARITQLETQIAAAQQHKQELEDKQGELDEKTTLLAQILEKAGTQQSGMEQRRQQGSQLDQEIAAIAAQRKALEQRWTQFEAQGELLAMEIVAVNAQRKELESQRRKIDVQRQELAEMIDRADRLHRRETSSAAIEPANDDFTYTYNSLMVDNSELDDMRGGFSIGDGFDVSFGFTQTGAVNGVEQFSNNFTIDSMATGFDDIDMSNMNSVVLQNGSGNFVSASVLDSLSDSFGNIIQNTLDDQVISTTTIFDISLHNVPGALQGLAGERALTDSLGSYR